MGRRSYAIYLWQLPIFIELERHTDAWPVLFGVGTGLTLLVAAASWRVVEAPWLDHRRIGREALTPFPG